MVWTSYALAILDFLALAGTDQFANASAAVSATVSASSLE